MTDEQERVIADLHREFPPATVNRGGRPFDERYHLPVRRYPRLLRWPLRWLQRLCRHHNTKADILEACGGVYAVRWCETCGAIMTVVDGAPCGMMRRPEPHHDD
jgi:hypothetical protein